MILKLVRIIARSGDNLPTNFSVSKTFPSRLIGHHLSDPSRRLATLTFDLGGHGTCQWCGSSCEVCVPNLEFVGLPIRKILGIYCVNISRPGDLDLWPLSLKQVCPIARWVYNLPTNFGVCRTFRSRLIGQHLSDASRDLATLTFDLGGHGACQWYGLGTASVYQVWTSQAFPFGRYWACTVWALVGLVTLTFNLLTSK